MEKEKKKKYHRENCDNRIRAVKVDSSNRKIILSGIHAFEWRVTIINKNTITVTTFSQRVIAVKEFKKYT